MSNLMEEKPHFVLVPMMAQGHIIPIIDMARLLAGRGATVTLVTTPANVSRISTTIDQVEKADLPVRFVSIPFPSVECGLPEGCENLDMLPSLDLVKNFFEAALKLHDPLVQCLQSHHPPPTCIVSDNAHYWVHDVAREFGVPWLVFHGYGSFPLLCLRNIRASSIEEKMKDEKESFLVPGLPHTIEMTRAQMPRFFSIPGMEKFSKVLQEADLHSDGVVLNSFEDLEPLYQELYGKAIGKKVWTIGPLSLSNRDVADLAQRGNKASVDEDQCLKWLDSMKPSSVVYVSFGTLAHTNPLQLVEIGLGLEASGYPFIWVIKAGERFSEVEERLSEFEERTRRRGLIVRGWAPQVMILSHPAVGGFMTHCGWNSMLESVSLGVPLITWPHFGEQFLNEKLVVEVLKIGVPIGVKARTPWKLETNEVLVTKTDVEKAVRSLIGEEGEEGEEMRMRSAELGRKARETMEGGGRSYSNLTELMQSIRASN